MKRYERTRVLVEGDIDLAQRIASEIEEVCEVEVLDAPREELVMVKVRESARGSLFYLGEALMCSCRVRLAGLRVRKGGQEAALAGAAAEGAEAAGAVGFGYVLGSGRNIAYNLALIDAAFSSGWEFEQMRKWEREIEREAKRLRGRAAKNHALVSRTRVDFSTMADGSDAAVAAEEGGAR